MARVSGPLMSMSASGTLASAITYSNWKGIPYVRRHAIPSNPRSAKQIAVRAWMRFFSREWPGNVFAFKADWATAAESLHQSGFNRYLAVNLNRVAHMEPPEAGPLLTPSGPIPDLPLVVAAGSTGIATLAITAGITSPTWGWAIFAKLGSAPTPSPATFVGATAYPYNNFAHTPIAPGTWHYIVRGFTLNLIWGDDSVDTTATVI